MVKVGILRSYCCFSFIVGILYYESGFIWRFFFVLFFRVWVSFLFFFVGDFRYFFFGEFGMLYCGLGFFGLCIVDIRLCVVMLGFERVGVEMKVWFFLFYGV